MKNSADGNASDETVHSRETQEAIIETIDRAANAIVELFYPHVEVVLHDVRVNQIARIWNPFSGRRVGGESLLEAELMNDIDAAEVMGPFEQASTDGNKLASVSVPVMQGRYLLCMNFNRAVVADAIEALQRLATPLSPMPEALTNDWRSVIENAVDRWCREHNRNPASLSRKDKEQIVAELEELQIFKTRNAVDHTAKSLGISRSSVYVLRNAVRDDFLANETPEK